MKKPAPKKRLTTEEEILAERQRRKALRLPPLADEEEEIATALRKEVRKLEGQLMALGVSRDELDEVQDSMGHDDWYGYIRRYKSAIAELMGIEEANPAPAAPAEPIRTSITLP